MARRKQKGLIPPQTVFFMLAILAGIVLIGKVAQSAPTGSANVVGLVFLLIVGAVVAVPVIRAITRAGARQALIQRVSATTDLQLDPLLRRRAQLVRLDPYGKPQREKWSKEIDYFIEQHIQPSLAPGEQLALRRNYAEIANIIGEKVEAAQRTQPAFQTFSEGMTPSEFETFCAEQLRLAGWNARVTMQSRDQGVDVVADKNGRRVVLQCKL